MTGKRSRKLPQRHIKKKKYKDSDSYKEMKKCYRDRATAQKHKRLRRESKAKQLQRNSKRQ